MSGESDRHERHIGPAYARLTGILPHDRDDIKAETTHDVPDDDRATLGWGPAPAGRYAPSSANAAGAYRANKIMGEKTGDSKYDAAAAEISQNTRGTERDRPEFMEMLLKIRGNTPGYEEEVAQYNSTRDTTIRYLEAFASGKETIDYSTWTDQELATAARKKSEEQSQKP